MQTNPSDRLPSLRRRLAAIGIALAVAVLAVLGAMLVSGSATHRVVEDSRIHTVPRILERQRATANLERLIRFGWISATATSAHDWRQASVTAQALAYHPSLSFDDEIRRQVMTVHAIIRQVVSKRERALALRNAASGGASAEAQAQEQDREARELWMPQETILVSLQGKLADDGVRLMVERFDRVAEIADLTRQLAIGAAVLILLILAAATLIVWRNLLLPVLQVAQTMRGTLDGGAPERSLPSPATAEMAVMQNAAVQLREALHRAALRETALKASEQRLSSIFATSEAAIVLSDAQGQVMQANDSFLRLIDHDKALDLSLDHLTHGDDATREAPLLRAMLNGETDRYRLDKRLRRHDGSCVWVDASVRAIRDGDAPPHQFVTVAIDISERMRAEQELLFIRALVDQSADPIYCLDPLDDGRMAWANAATCRHFGTSPTRMLTMRISDWDPNFDAEAVKKLWQNPEPLSTRVFETTHRVAGGDVIPVEVSATWLEHDGKPYVAGYIRDIRDRNRMLMAVRRSNEDLQQFAYVASHDLQEPLRMVASFLQLLERRYADRLDAAGREYIQFAVDGAVRMKQLIEDLLAYSRIDSRGLQPQPVDLAVIAQAACDNLVSAIAENGGRVSLADDLPTVMGDQPQLIRLLQNLIGNALKYRAPDRFPDIAVSAQRHGDTWIIAVSDNGIGIAPQYHDRIFMIFQRLHGIAAYEGTGIGLAICKRIVERHGGEIWVESQENVGSIFKFTLHASDVVANE